MWNCQDIYRSHFWTNFSMMMLDKRSKVEISELVLNYVPFLIMPLFDPLGRPTVMAGRDHCFCTCPSVPTFQNLAKQNKDKTMFATGKTVGQGEWIIDDTCLVYIIIKFIQIFFGTGFYHPVLRKPFSFHIIFDMLTSCDFGHLVQCQVHGAWLEIIWGLS